MDVNTPHDNFGQNHTSNKRKTPATTNKKFLEPNIILTYTAYFQHLFREPNMTYLKNNFLKVGATINVYKVLWENQNKFA